MTDYTVKFWILTKDDYFPLTKILKGNDIYDVFNEAKQIAFSEYRDSIVGLTVQNENEVIRMEI